jgi:ATP-dependent DNA ligase
MSQTQIPEFPKLYINNKKKIYEWSIKIVPKDNNIFTIVTSHGEKDGKIVTHEKDITEGKVKRSVLEQTIQEVKRKWDNKKEKELYSEDLDISNNSDNLKDVVVRPMLANTFSFDVYKSKSRAFKISFPAYIQKKYDGIRCISYLKDDKVILESRKGVKFQNFNLLKEQLYVLFKKLPKNFYFDGELYTDKLDFEVISGLIRLHEKKITPKDASLIDNIEYHIYDFVNLNDESLIYKDRYHYLTNFLSSNINSNSLYKQVDTILIDKLDDIKTYHDNFVKDGYEGIMIRDPNGIYETNKRSKYLQKFKEFLEEEFKIVGFHEGSGDEKGSIIWNCITKDNQEFSVRPKGTFESRKKLFDNGNEYIGKLLTVIFQEYSADGIPRFPVGKGIRDIY